MNRTDTARCYALVAAAYGLHPSPATVEAWHLLLADLDGPTALDATHQLCRRDTQWPPRPGEIVAQVARLIGTELPPLDAALGFYETGQWDAHPAIRRAAQSVYWDRHTEPDKARWSFTHAYEAALYDDDTGTVRPTRAPVTAGPTRLALADPGRTTDLRPPTSRPGDTA